jgi:hypothetical protein
MDSVRSTNLNGNIQVAARKGDVNVEREVDKPSPETEAWHGYTVHEGEQKSFDQSEMCGAPARPLGASTSVNPKWIVGGAAGGGLLLCVLLCHGGGGSKPPLSTSAP